MKNVLRPANKPNKSMKFPRLFVVVFLFSKHSSEKPKESLNIALPTILFRMEFAKFILEKIRGTERTAVNIPKYKCEVSAGSKYGTSCFIKYTTTVYIPKKSPKLP